MLIDRSRRPLASEVGVVIEAALAECAPPNSYEIAWEASVIPGGGTETVIDVHPKNEQACPIEVSAVENGLHLWLGWGDYSGIEIPLYDDEWTRTLPAPFERLRDVIASVVGGKAWEELWVAEDGTVKAAQPVVELGDGSVLRAPAHGNLISDRGAESWGEDPIPVQKKVVEYEPYE